MALSLCNTPSLHDTPFSVRYSPTSTQREICMEDHHLAEQISFGPIYLYHLETLEAQRAAIAASIPLAA